MNLSSFWYSPIVPHSRWSVHPEKTAAGVQLLSGVEALVSRESQLQ